MASYNELNALIDAYINRNGVQAITGQILNGVLKAMVEQLGRGYTIMGAATPTTDPGTPDGPECYFASEVGTYTDFDGLQVVPGELALLCYTPTDGWTKETIYEGFQEVEATIDENVGTPSVGVSYANGVLSFDFHNMKGNPGQNGQDGQDGDPAGFGTIGADITGGVGTPGVSVESSGPATAKNLQFHFTNLKGETGVTSVVATVDNTTGTPACTVSLVGQQLTLAFSGLKGAQGDTGSSVDYPFTIVNNLTTNDATQALSAAMGVELAGQVSQLQQKVDGITLTWQEGYINSSGVLTAPDGYSQITSQKLTAEQANGIKITFGGTYCIRLAYFNGDTLVSRTSIIESTSSPYTIETEYDVYISLMTKYYSSYTMSQMLGNYTFDMPGGLIPRVSSLETSMATADGEIEQIDDDLYSNITLSWESGYINSSGNLTAQDGYSQYTSQLLSKNDANKILATFGAGYSLRIAEFNGGTFVGRSDIINSSSSPYQIESDYSVRITIMTQVIGTSYTLDQMLAHYSFSYTIGLMYRTTAIESKLNEISPIVANLGISVYGIPLEWTSGNINDSGSIVSPTQSNYYSQILPNSEVDGISIEVDSGYICNLAFYDNGIFVTRYGWIYNTSGKVTISTQYDARIMICVDAFDNTKTAEEIVPHIHITGIEEGLEKRVERLEDANNSSEFLSRMVACDFNGKILHFSFDDVCWCLYDLIQNEATYTDIFDEPFFGMLKEVHDTTGMVFTLNTFNEIGANSSGYYPTGFDIENVPTKFQSNFQANKGWLKFAFHAKDEDTNYNTASGAGTDYGVFVSAIYTLTGDYDCIDHVTRLGYFGGTKENCLALRDAEHGVFGFFGADDTRAYDYYLSSSQYAWLRKKGKYIDAENELFFIKTQYRTFATGEQDVENNLCFQKVTEFFAHEYEAHLGATWDLTAMKNNILSLATWATGLGYKFEYPEKIYG